MSAKVMQERHKFRGRFPTHSRSSLFSLQVQMQVSLSPRIDDMGNDVIEYSSRSLK
jgi:hypothetical protein